MRQRRPADNNGGQQDHDGEYQAIYVAGIHHRYSSSQFSLPSFPIQVDRHDQRPRINLHRGASLRGSYNYFAAAQKRNTEDVSRVAFCNIYQLASTGHSDNDTRSLHLIRTQALGIIGYFRYRPFLRDPMYSSKLERSRAPISRRAVFRLTCQVRTISFAPKRSPALICSRNHCCR